MIQCRVALRVSIKRAEDSYSDEEWEEMGRMLNELQIFPDGRVMAPSLNYDSEDFASPVPDIELLSQLVEGELVDEIPTVDKDPEPPFWEEYYAAVDAARER